MSLAMALQSGDVLLFSTRTLTVANVIQAHKSPLSFLSINSTDSLLTTSSDKGTVIRVWSIPGAEKLYQFRRGTREARIYSMSFNLVSSLAVNSVHDTVHIFKLGQQSASKNNSGASNLNQSSSSPPESVEGASPPASLEGGYESFIEKKKSKSISRVSIVPPKLAYGDVEPSRDFAFLRSLFQEPFLDDAYDEQCSVKELGAFDDFRVRSSWSFAFDLRFKHCDVLCERAGNTSIEAVLCFYHTTSRRDLPLIDGTQRASANARKNLLERKRIFNHHRRRISGARQRSILEIVEQRKDGGLGTVNVAFKNILPK
ncbi:hypothetical protein BYT27DRAFT_7337085 [Phlegmacium glaucopus]|nr:hypothetical protein BYT27DRAFT_7337085 [Phlegmacium glaucopus]